MKQNSRLSCILVIMYPVSVVGHGHEHVSS